VRAVTVLVAITVSREVLLNNVDSRERRVVTVDAGIQYRYSHAVTR
jgi:hypothetical protein